MWKSSTDRYGRVAITIHWISAAMVIGLMIAGQRAADMTDLEAKASLLRIHAPMGAAILVLTLARISWWLFADTKRNVSTTLRPQVFEFRLGLAPFFWVG